MPGTDGVEGRARMALEVEVKVALETGADEIDARLRAVGARRVEGPRLEDDRLFDTEDRDLRADDRLLRLRRRGDRAWLTSKGPARADGELKVREEHETEVHDLEATTRILRGLGLVPVVRYQKVRARYRLDDVEICVDRTPAGNFLELEGGGPSIRRVAARLGIEEKRFDRRDYLRIWREAGGCGDMIFREEP